MGTLLRGAIVWLAAASFAALSLVGDGLHGIPGFQHGIAPRHGCSSSQGGCCAPVAYDAGCGGPGPSAGAEPEVPAERSSPTEKHTCPVCRLLAQAKTAPTVAELPPLGEPVADDPVFSSPCYASAPAHAFDARGPPWDR